MFIVFSSSIFSSVAERQRWQRGESWALIATTIPMAFAFLLDGSGSIAHHSEQHSWGSCTLLGIKESTLPLHFSGLLRDQSLIDSPVEPHVLHVCRKNSALPSMLAQILAPWSWSKTHPWARTINKLSGRGEVCKDDARTGRGSWTLGTRLEIQWRSTSIHADLVLWGSISCTLGRRFPNWNEMVRLIIWVRPALWDGWVPEEGSRCWWMRSGWCFCLLCPGHLARDANLWAPSVQGSSGLSQCRAFVDLLSRELGQDNEAQWHSLFPSMPDGSHFEYMWCGSCHLPILT